MDDSDGWRTYDTDEPLDSFTSQKLFKWICSSRNY